MRRTLAWTLVPVVSCGLTGAAFADDFPNSPATNGFLQPGGSVTGVLEFGNDQDWFAIDLQANVPIVLDLEGQQTNRGSLNDPYLYVYNTNGQELARNDDGGRGLNSRLSFTPPYSGRFYIGAGSWSNNTGSYTLTAGGSSGGGGIAFDDFPSNAGTGGRLNVPGAVTGNLENGNDEDWFAVQLQGGVAYTFDMEGQPTGRGSLSDPLLHLYDGFGNQVGRNDDGGQGFNARLTYTAPSSGTYFVGARSFGNNAGTYSLSASGAGGPVTVDDFPSNAGTSGRLSIPGAVTGNLENGSDEDWFAVQLQGGVAYTFDMEGQPTGRGSLSDPLLHLYDGFGNQVGRNDDGGQGFNARLTYTAPASGTYFVGARSFGNNAGTYSLSASGIGGPVTADDYPNNAGTSGRVGVPGSVTGNLENGNDEDWFAVQLQGGVAYTFDMEGQPTGRGSLGDPLLHLYDGFGNQVGRNDDGGQGFNARLTYTAPSNGTYYLGARSFGSASGTYTLTASSGGGGVPDDYPSNPGTSGRLNVPGSATGNLEHGNDADWFAVQLQGGVAYTIDLEGSETNRGSLRDPLLSVHDSFGNQVGRNDDGGQGLNSQLTFTPPSNGTYYLAAQSFGGSSGTYTLSATGAAAFDDYPSNSGTSGRLNVPGSTNGNLENGNDEDWFAVQLQGGVAYTFDLEGQPTNRGSLSDPLLHLYDGFGNQVGRNDDGGQGFNARLTYTPPSTGTYYVGARSFGSNAGTYTLSATGAGPADDYPGDSTTSGRVNVPGSVTGTIETRDDADWFAAQLQGGVAYTINLEGSETNRGTLRDPLLSVHDSFGNQVGRNDDGGQGLNAQLTFTPPANGTYYLAAQSWGGSTGTYTLSVAGSQARIDDFPNTPGTSGRVSVPGSVTGNLEAGDDEDWFAVQLQGGVTVTIDMEGSETNRGSLRDPLLQLYDGSGTQVARNDDGGQGLNAQLTFTPPSAGTYFIGARSWGSNAGTYTVTVSSQGGPTDDYPANPGTSGQLSLPGSVTGNLEAGDDEDWFAVQLPAGVTVTIDMEGSETNRGSLRDPLIHLYDGSGSQVARNDDGGDGLNARLTFSAPSAGTYFIGARSFANSSGTYTLSIR